MVRVKCINTISPDLGGAKWPAEMAARPLVGDLVRSEGGELTLKVVYVIHTTHKDYYAYDKPARFEQYPVLEVHLGDRD